MWANGVPKGMESMVHFILNKTLCSWPGRQGAVRRGWAWLGGAGHGLAGMARQGEARQGKAWLGLAGAARHGAAGQGMAWRGLAGLEY